MGAALKIDELKRDFSWLLEGGKAFGGLKSLKAATLDEYISEAQAAEMLGYKRPKTLREKVKKGEIEINWRTNPSGRCYQYNLKDIIKFKKSTSTEV